MRGTPYEVTTFRGEGAYSDGRRPDTVEFVTTSPPISRAATSRSTRSRSIRTTATSSIRTTGRRTSSAASSAPSGKPLERFPEDGLRVLRAARFSATLEFELDPETERADRAEPRRLREGRAERVRDEWMKTMKAKQPSRAFDVMRKTASSRSPARRCSRASAWSRTSGTRTTCGATPWRASTPARAIRSSASPRCSTTSASRAPARSATRRRTGRSTTTSASAPRSPSRSARGCASRTRSASASSHLVRHHLFHYTSDWNDAAVRRCIARRQRPARGSVRAQRGRRPREGARRDAGLRGARGAQGARGAGARRGRRAVDAGSRDRRTRSDARARARAGPRDRRGSSNALLEEVIADPEEEHARNAPRAGSQDVRVRRARPVCTVAPCARPRILATSLLPRALASVARRRRRRPRRPTIIVGDFELSPELEVRTRGEYRRRPRRHGRAGDRLLHRRPVGGHGAFAPRSRRGARRAQSEGHDPRRARLGLDAAHAIFQNDTFGSTGLYEGFIEIHTTNPPGANPGYDSIVDSRRAAIHPHRPPGHRVGRRAPPRQRRFLSGRAHARRGARSRRLALARLRSVRRDHGRAASDRHRLRRSERQRTSAAPSSMARSRRSRSTRCCACSSTGCFAPRPARRPRRSRRSRPSLRSRGRSATTGRWRSASRATRRAGPTASRARSSSARCRPGRQQAQSARVRGRRRRVAALRRHRAHAHVKIGGATRAAAAATQYNQFDPLYPDVQVNHGLLGAFAWSNLIDAHGVREHRADGQPPRDGRVPLRARRRPGDRRVARHVLARRRERGRHDVARARSRGRRHGLVSPVARAQHRRRLLAPHPRRRRQADDARRKPRIEERAGMLVPPDLSHYAFIQLTLNVPAKP